MPTIVHNYLDDARAVPVDVTATGVTASARGGAPAP